MRTFTGIIHAFILGLLFAMQANGQPTYIFHHLTTENGLSNSNIRAILKDRYGFLWIATAYGLNRYDGYGFKSYIMKSGMPNSLSSNDIQELQEDGLGNLWVRGVSYVVYNRQKDNFITDVPKFLQNLGIQVDGNYKIYVDKRQDLWVLTRQKAFFYDTRKKSLKVFELKVQIDDETTTELADDGESLYGISNSGFLWQISKRSGNQTLFGVQNIVKGEAYPNLYVDSRKGIWIFTSINGVIYRKNPNEDWVKLSLSAFANDQNIRILQLMDDANGNIWIGTDHNGLFIYDRANDVIANLLNDPSKSASIASNNVTCIYRDNNGTIWLGHSKKGISYYHDSFLNIVNFEDPNCRDINAILEDRDGNIWLGTDGNGLYKKGKTKDSEINKIPIGNRAVVSLLEDRKGRIWIGTFMDGLFCLENGKINHFTKDNSRLAGNDIWNLVEDRYGNLWIGTLGGGLQCLRNGNVNLDSLITVCETLKHPLSMHYDGGDKLYIGSVWGLYLVDITTSNYTIFTSNKKGTQTFREMLISNVFRDVEDNIWLGHLEGLTLWDRKKDTLYFIDKEQGLSDNTVHGIIEDNHRNIWVTSSNGLSVLSLSRDARGIVHVTSRNFSTKDGFKDNYFNNHAIYKLKDGDILLGGTEGFIKVNPIKIDEKNKPPAKVIFTGLTLGNSKILVDSAYRGRKILTHPMELTNALRFAYNDRLISLQFATGDLLNADKVKYAYKLDGFHNQWQNTTENRIVFSSLAPGDYMLFVKACNSDGVWSDQTSVLSIEVMPPFYLSTTAKISYILIFIGMIAYGLYNTRKKHILKLEQQRIQLEHEQKANLDEMKLRFFTNVSHDLRTPLTLILTPLQTILNGPLEESVRKKLDMIRKSAEHLLHLINTLLDFRKLDVGVEILRQKSGDLVGFIKELCVPFYSYAIDRQIRFSVVDKVETQSVQFDHDKIRKTMLNLLSNAFKFTPDGGTVTVSMYKDNDRICVAVSDTGVGICDADKPHVFERFYQALQQQEHTGSGLGLHIASEYVRMHGGIITVENNAPKGTIFIVKLPVENAEINEKRSTEESETDEVFDSEEKSELHSRPVLLFVDDNRDLCEFMADSISDDYTVLLAFNGEEALDQLQKTDVNIVVSDVMMPVMSGIELCERIKNNIQWSHIPVILLTARTAEENQLEGLKVGADDYLTKPFNFNILKLRIQRFIEWTEKCHRSFSQKLDVSPGEITITPLDEHLIGKAINVVEEHINDADFSVEELATIVGLSRSHLYKKLMSITGKGPAEFIRTIRLKRGRQLLEKSQLQIAEIAYNVGFNSPKRFTINFKNEFGISPSDYVRGMKNPK